MCRLYLRGIAMNLNQNIYLDNNATTSLDPDVLEAMLPYFKGTFGNPSSTHTHGQQARRGLDNAREQTAATLNADPEEIIFTSGATEANNMAILGHQQAQLPQRPHILTSAPVTLNLMMLRMYSPPWACLRLCPALLCAF